MNHIHRKLLVAGSGVFSLMLAGGAFAQSMDSVHSEMNGSDPQAEVMVHPDTVYTHPQMSSESDRAITRQIVSLLANDHRIGSENIGVRTVNGVVYLSGRVNQPTGVYRAVELARQIAGVRAVNDNQLDA